MSEGTKTNTGFIRDGRLQNLATDLLCTFLGGEGEQNSWLETGNEARVALGT